MFRVPSWANGTRVNRCIRDLEPELTAFSARLPRSEISAGVGEENPTLSLSVRVSQFLKRARQDSNLRPAD